MIAKQVTMLKYIYLCLFICFIYMIFFFCFTADELPQPGPDGNPLFSWALFFVEIENYTFYLFYNHSLDMSL